MIIATMISGAGILAVLVGVGVYGLLRGPESAQTPSAPTGSPTIAPTAAPIAHPQPLPATTDPELFARAAASALFRWDTRGSAGPTEWAQTLIDVGDRDEAAGLASDIRGYLPTVEQWQRLDSYGTRQWLTIDSVRVPVTWASAVAEAAPGQLPPGAIAYTIGGVRHRSGNWDGKPTATAGEARFTVFIACPRAEDCRLLRLSRLNEPLE